MKLVIRYYPLLCRYALGEIHDIQFMAWPVTLDVLSRRLSVEFDITEKLQVRAIK